MFFLDTSLSPNPIFSFIILCFFRDGGVDFFLDISRLSKVPLGVGLSFLDIVVLVEI